MCVSCLVTLWITAQILGYLALNVRDGRNATMAYGDGDTLIGVPHTTGALIIETYETSWIHWELMEWNGETKNEPARQQ